MSTKAKLKKLRKRLRRFISRSYREQLEQKNELSRILRKLKKRQKALERKLENLPEEDRKAYREEAELIQAQREKAHRLLKELKEGKAAS